MDLYAELTRIRRLRATGQYRRAQRRCLAALEQFPDNPRLRATKVSLDAYLGSTTFAEAEHVLREMADRHPDDVRLAMQPMEMVIKQGRLADAVVEARELTERFAGDPYAELALAGYIHANPETEEEAWALFRRTLTTLSSATPCHRTAAYRLARKYEPSLAPEVLRGASSLEQAAIRTRALGYTTLSLGFLVLMIGAVALRADRVLWVGVLLACLAVSLGVWMIVCNQMVCCTRCRNAWLADLALLGFLFLLAPGDPWWFWVLVGIVYAIVFVVGLRVRTILGSRKPGTGRRRATAGTREDLPSG